MATVDRSYPSAEFVCRLARVEAENLDLRSEVARQRDAIAELRQEVREQHASLASRVTTNELVIVDNDGRERISLHATTRDAAVLLHAYGGRTEAPSMSLALAADDPAGDTPARVYAAAQTGSSDECCKVFGFADEVDGIADIESLLA